MQVLKLAEQEIEVTQKNIKNLHLSVYPPDGKVKVSAPKYMNIDTIRSFIISKLPWIRKQQAKILSQDREAPREYIDRESHYFKGERYLLEIHETTGAHKVIVTNKTLQLHVRKNADLTSRKRLLEQFYRDYLKNEVPKYIKKYEELMDVQVKEFGVKKMKTRWGTCNYHDRRIWVNLELAKKPPKCLEYLVVHEMVHILEKSHNIRFKTLMDKFYPKWRQVREELNRLPVRHEDWVY